MELDRGREAICILVIVSIFFLRRVLEVVKNKIMGWSIDFCYMFNILNTKR